MYTFYVKKENLALSKGRLNIKIIGKYYDILKDPENNKYKDKKKRLELYLEFTEKNDEQDGELIDKIRN